MSHIVPIFMCKRRKLPICLGSSVRGFCYMRVKTLIYVAILGGSTYCGSIYNIRLQSKRMVAFFKLMCKNSSLCTVLCVGSRCYVVLKTAKCPYFCVQEHKICSVIYI